MKLHLPKFLLTAVLSAAVVVGSQAQAATGWDGNTFYVGDTGTTGVNRDGVGEVTETTGEAGTVTHITEINAITVDKSAINFWADRENDKAVIAEVGTLKVKEGITISASKSDWGSRYFDALTIESLDIQNGGAVNLNIAYKDGTYTNKVCINAVNGSIGTSTVASDGALVIGKDSNSITNFSGTITNSGTIKLEGTLSASSDGNFVLKDGTLQDTFTKDGGATTSTNGFAYLAGSQVYLVDGTGEFEITADTITVGSNSVTLDKTSEAGKVSFDFGRNYYQILDEYHVNESESLASTTASKYILADSATLTWTDALINENVRTVEGNGTVVATIGTNGNANHNNYLKLGSDFNGVLQLSRADASDTTSGKMELCKFEVGSNAIFKLMSGEHWSSGGTISNAIILGAENETDFTFNHYGTLILSGQVTGSHLYSKSSITLTNAGTNISNVRMDGGTLKVSNTMNFGTVNAATMEVDEGYFAKISSGLTGSRNFTKTGAGTLELNGSNSEYTGAITVNGGKVSLGGTNSTGSGSITLNNASSLELRWGASINSNVAIALNGGSIIEMRNGGAGNVLKAAISVNESGYISGSSTGGGSDVQGTITGHGTLGLLRDRENDNPWKISATISDDSTAPLAVEIYGGKLDNGTPVKSGENKVTISGSNTYTGGTTIEGGTVTTANVSALGTGKVTMNGGTLKMADARTENDTRIPGDLTISAMDYNGGTVNNNGQKLTVTGKLTAAANMTIEGSGDTELGSLDLTAGTTLSTSGSLTIGDLILDLSKYSTEQDSYTLISANGLSFGENVNLSSYQNQNINGFITELVQDGNSLTLNFKLESGPSDSLTSVTVLSASLDGTVLTLNVDADLTDVTSLDLTLSAAALADIKGLTGEVSLALVDCNSGLFTTVETDGATLISNVSFYGSYVGEGQGMYYVQYIPEPASATLSLAALMMLAARRRRRA